MGRLAALCDCGEHAFVRLTKWHTALVDADDLPIIAGHLWCVDAKRGRDYAIRAVGPKAKRRFVYMHRDVLRAPDGFDVDHINQGDGTDNRKLNLRIADRSMNNANQRPRGGTSKFKGVHFHKQTQKWHAQIRLKSYRKSLGLYSDQEDAALAYDTAAVQLFGEFAATNEKLGLFKRTKHV